MTSFYYIKLKSRLSDRHAVIEMGLARNESCVFKQHKVYFYKLTEPTIHR